MLNKGEIHEALSKVATLLVKMADIQKQHNTMLLDLYERVTKIERSEK